MTEKVKLTLRGSGEPVELVGTNQGVIAQVKRNRELRKVLGDRAANLILLEVQVKDTVMLLDSRAVLIAFFAAQTSGEKRAVHEAEEAVRVALRIGLSQPRAKRIMDYANDILWLGITGNVQDVDPEDRAGLSGSSIGSGSWMLQHPIEPTFGAMPYEDM